MSPLVLFLLLVFGHALVSRRLERSFITAPIIFAAAGLAASNFLTEPEDTESAMSLFLHLAEIGLVLLLFADASRTDLGLLRGIRNLPIRLLSVGRLLNILLGALAAKLLFPQLTVWEAGILAAILAPDRRRTGAGHREQPARTYEDPAGAQCGSGAERRSIRTVLALLHGNGC